jgi:excisionase family DNA binding protein
MTDIILHTSTPDELKQLISDAVIDALAEKNTPPQPEQDELIKVSQACELLNVSSVTIHAWKKAGLIPFYRISNKVYFKKSELIDSLKKARKGK